MWRDVSNNVTMKGDKIIHEGRAVGFIKQGIIAVSWPGYRARIVRDYDDEGVITRFFIEQEYNLRDKILVMQKSEKIIPFLEVRMKFIEVAEGHYVILEKIEDVKRTIGNRCKITLDSGTKYEINYDARRFKEKMEELDKQST